MTKESTTRVMREPDYEYENNRCACECAAQMYQTGWGKMIVLILPEIAKLLIILPLHIVL